ncbi:hypothetical protein GCM10009678_92220 [Actinomadura kijaniata]
MADTVAAAVFRLARTYVTDRVAEVRTAGRAYRLEQAVGAHPPCLLGFIAPQPRTRPATTSTLSCASEFTAISRATVGCENAGISPWEHREASATRRER